MYMFVYMFPSETLADLPNQQIHITHFWNVKIIHM